MSGTFQAFQDMSTAHLDGAAVNSRRGTSFTNDPCHTQLSPVVGHWYTETIKYLGTNERDDLGVMLN